MKPLTFIRKFCTHRFGVKRVRTASLLWALLSGIVLTSLPATADTTDVNPGSPVYGAVINGGDVQNVNSGGIAGSTIVHGGGTQNVSAGGSATYTQLSGGVQNVLSGGSATTVYISSGGAQNVSAGGSAYGTTILSGTQTVAGSVSSVGVYASGASQVVLSGGVASGVYLASGGQQIVSAGGSATQVRISAGSMQTVSAGGSASSATVLSGGTQTVAGTVDSSTINAGGTVVLQSGGVASSTQLYGGNQLISSGGRAIGGSISSNGTQTIQSGGSATSFMVYYGNQVVSGGGSATSTTLGYSGTQTVSSGGYVSATTINSGGQQIVQSGGHADGVTVNSGGTQNIYGAVYSSTVSAGGTVALHAGGYLGGGIRSGAILSATTDAGMDALYLSGSSSINMRIHSGIASGVILDSGSVLEVTSGGSAQGTVVNAGGQLKISSGGSTTSTSLSGGTLLNDGTLTGITLTAARLGGSGVVTDALTVTSGSTLMATEVGKGLTINNDLTFASGSFYSVAVNAAGGTGLTTVNGNVTLAGTVNVTAANGSYAQNTTYKILSYTGTRTGAFDSVTSDLAFLTPTLSYAANVVDLTMTRNDASFASVAQTGNQRSVARALDALGSGAVHAAVTGLSATQARSAFNALSGAQHAAGSLVAMNVGSSFSDALMSRAAVAGSQVGGPAALRYASLNLAGVTSWQGLFASPYQLARTPSLETASSPTAVSRFNAASGNAPVAGVWFQVLGGKGEVKGDGNGSGSDYSSTGFLAGYDTALNADWLMGVALGYGKTRWDASVPASGNVDTHYAALYGRYTSGPWQIRLNGSFADNRFDTTRTVAIGAASSQARSMHSGREWSVGAEAEYALTKAAGWDVRPLATIRYTYLDEDGFSESGSPAALRVNGRSAQQAKLGVGSRFLRAFDNGAGSGALELRALVTHLAGDNDAPVTASFVGTNNTFNAAGTPLRRTALALGAGFSLQVSNKLSVFADLGYETRGGGQTNSDAAIGVRYRW